MKQLKGKELLESIISSCEKSYARWQEIFENGCSDPNWTDGCNLNLVRNHIIYDKKQIEKLCTELGEELPFTYLRELPPQVAGDYMARANQIKEEGMNFLKKIRSNKDFKELKEIYQTLSPNQKKEHQLDFAVSKEKWIQKALDENNLVNVRCYVRNQKEYFEAVTSALALAKSFPAEIFQLSLFDSA